MHRWPSSLYWLQPRPMQSDTHRSKGRIARAGDRPVPIAKAAKINRTTTRIFPGSGFDSPLRHAITRSSRRTTSTHEHRQKNKHCLNILFDCQLLRHIIDAYSPSVPRPSRSISAKDIWDDETWQRTLPCGARFRFSLFFSLACTCLRRRTSRRFRSRMAAVRAVRASIDARRRAGGTASKPAIPVAAAERQGGTSVGRASRYSGEGRRKP
jgi:hypothetical protein